jgi:subtilase family serine protease
MNKKTSFVLPALLVVFFGLAGVCHAQSAGDFVYRVHPPRVEVIPTGEVPTAIPFCPTSVGTLICYTPSFVRAVYDFPSTLDGTGQTILIVDAFGSPTIQNDLAVFDRIFSIPPPPSFTVFCPEGCPPFNPRNSHGEVDWALETSLDVEYAHAMAPGANIVLVVAATNSGNAINVAEAMAIQRYPGSIMSQSFGIPEIQVRGNNAQIIQAEKNYAAAAAAGITVLASAGDSGATNGFSAPNALFPSSDPWVVAVGGTEGNPYPGGLAECSVTSQTCEGKYGGEQVWNEPQFASATGGAPSLFFDVPSYQNGLGLKARTTPDISYNAAVNGGVLVYTTFLGSPILFIVGGTSAGSPQWAAIFALANQLAGKALGFINPALYSLARSTAYHLDFHDITKGNNQLAGTPLGFTASPGYDDASGWGTPDVARLVLDLVQCATTTTCP